MSDRTPASHDDLREGDLLAYLDGAAPPALAAHIGGCPRCQAELAGLRAAEALLGAALTRAACPPAEALLRHQAGLLDAAAARDLQAHLAGCADCAAELALLAAPPEPALPGRLLRAGARLVRALRQPGAPPALALRGGERAPRRAVFAAEGYEVVVVVAQEQPAASRYQLEGQVLAPGGGQPGVARLSGSAQPELEAEVDALGFFAFDAVPPGAYTLAIGLPDADVITEIIDVP